MLQQTLNVKKLFSIKRSGQALCADRVEWLRGCFGYRLLFKSPLHSSGNRSTKYFQLNETFFSTFKWRRSIHTRKGRIKCTQWNRFISMAWWAGRYFFRSRSLRTFYFCGSINISFRREESKYVSTEKLQRCGTEKKILSTSNIISIHNRIGLNWGCISSSA